MVMEALSPEQIAELYETRLVVLVETAPQSNRYHQVRLNQSQYHRVANAVEKNFITPDGIATLKTNQRQVVLPDLNSFYD